MDSFVFALDTTMPVFLVILLGWFLRRVGVLNEAFCKPADHYVFKCALPVSLFLSIAKMDVYSDFDPVFCLFLLHGDGGRLPRRMGADESG
ncbi:MAG: AEC family transporter [Christensenellales bacterium]